MNRHASQIVSENSLFILESQADFFFNDLVFIYFWLHWVFVAAVGFLWPQ